MNDFKDLIGKTIVSAEQLEHPSYDDSGWLKLTFSDNTSAVIISGYGDHTGDSSDEYPTYISIVDGEDFKFGEEDDINDLIEQLQSELEEAENQLYKVEMDEIDGDGNGDIVSDDYTQELKCEITRIKREIVNCNIDRLVKDENDQRLEILALSGNSRQSVRLTK